MDDLLAEFLTESAESIAEVDSALVKLERTPDDQATLGLIFRLVHTIKGTCGFLGLPRLERVAHAAENVLGQVRDGQLVVSAVLISPVLGAIDAIKTILAHLSATGAEPAGEDTATIAALDRLLAGADAADHAAPAAAFADPFDDLPHPVPSVAEAPAAVEVAPPKAAPVADRPAPATAAPAEHAEPVAAAAAAQTIRVGVDVLEHLMTLVSELVLARNQLLQLARGEENPFAAPLQRLSHITSDLQEGVMKTRMQPIGHAWNKLPRLIRDLAHDLDKKIELVMLGQETELDRQVLELIRDPLTHMVRNSGDHGLESTARRKELGKPETGRVTLNAFHEGGHIVIEIADDGAGLDVARIRAKAAAQGLATEAELAVMPDAQLHRFIFHAGFSTAAAITAVSGRGVGMDVVRTNVERIGGVIDLRSVPGEGTTFTIKIPLTLAIVSALIVQSRGERFAIPQLSVVELVRVEATGSPGSTGRTIEQINGTPVLRLRDRLLPLIELHTLLRLDPEEVPPGAAHERTTIVVVVAVGSATLGIVVDRVFDTEEIVVKPVAPVLRHITMFSGNTILGDGSVIMILDPNGIARASGIGGGREGRAVQAGPAAQNSTDTTAMLLFRAGPGAPKAVPLELVARLEDIARERIETAGGLPVTQYRGRLMPLLAMDGVEVGVHATQPVLVFSDAGRTMGMMVDEIVDVVQDRLSVEIGCGRTGLLGTAVIAGQATDVVDIGHWLTLAWRDWFGAPVAQASQRRLLVVEDSGFFRNLLVPTLSAAGYDVTHVGSGAGALKLRDGGARFDAIVSDIEMPEMDGYALARKIREPGPWADLPLIALSGSGTPALSREAGFDDHVSKSERDTLMATLQRHVASRPAALPPASKGVNQPAQHQPA
jgi:two-component system chemotaxis sensor kinase CheA